MMRTTQAWPLPIRLATTGIALATTFLFQLPLEREVPGDPFVLFLLVVIASTLAFGARVGFISVALSTLLSIMFFEPFGTLAIRHAADVIKIEVYAILAACSVIAFARLGDALNSATHQAEELKQLEESKSILFRELAHGVANNFATVAAFISMKSNSITDSAAKSILEEAIEQVRVMGSVHRRLRGGARIVTLDSRDYLEDLCDELQASLARGRPISIECKADSLPLCSDQAVPLGLIVNELVTNAIKHAFPQDRQGCIRVDLVARENQMFLSVEDDGVGFRGGIKKRPGGMGQDLVRGLVRQLEGRLEVKTTKTGTSFRVSIRSARADLSIQASQSSRAHIH
jgi:two-component sensor histidine kinase